MTSATTSLLDAIPVGAKAPLRIPAEFDRLYDLAYNMWWAWDPVAYQIWSQLDPRAWVSNRNPLSILQVIEPATWEALASNATFIDLYTESIDRFDQYMAGGDTWAATLHGEDMAGPIAYLSAEYGIHQKLPLYSGGLGVLSGDHLKAASDLGIPLFGVGILYRRGYFRQNVDPDGWQQHIYSVLEISRRPVREVLDRRTGRPLRVELTVGSRPVVVGAWRLDVGRVPLILLDADLPENDPADRPITHILYVRGREMRFVQEMVLGIGGARVIEALGLDPAVWHVNEGHASLALLERLSRKVTAGATVDDALAEVKRNTLFTLHTPVPAGNEVFDRDVAARCLEGSLAGLDGDDIAALGASGTDHQFDLGALAIRMSAKTNGVSKRHAAVVTGDWRDLIGGEALAITNGMHPQTWLGRNIERQFRRAVGEDWIDRLANPEEWKALHDLDDEDLWRAHEAQKELMLRRLRGRLREELARHGNAPDRLRWIDDQLPSSRLTVVFARRFATYKRAGLILTDPQRITRILTDPERPVQLIFSGKAHPADREGQALVRWVVEMSQRPELEGYVYFIEDYDMQLARTLVSGADVWLNNPRPPKEASGTSGMKAAANGAVNLSVLDGWWAEGYNGRNGWAWGEHHESDEADAARLYDLLETEVVPRYYERDERGIPTAWIAMMKESMVTAMSGFTSHRQLMDYAEKAYVPLAHTPS